MRSTPHAPPSPLTGPATGPLTGLLSGLNPVLLVALLSCVALAACGSDGPKQLTKTQKLGLYLENSLRYYEMGDLDRAQDQAQRALKLDPKNERFLLMLGKIHLNRDTTEDILIAERIFERHPNQKDYRVKLGLGAALERKGTLEDQASVAIRSGQRYTDHADPERRAEELEELAKKHWKRAYQQYELAIAYHSGEIAATNGLIRTSGLLGWDARSIEWARALIKALGASTTVRRLELEEVAIDAEHERKLRASIRANTDLTVQSHEYVAEIYYRMGRKDDALEELSRVIELDPERNLAYSRRAQLFYEAGQYLAAKDSIQRYLRLSTDLPFEDENIRGAYELLTQCEVALASGGSGGP